MKRVTEAELAKELREKYIKNPPEGMTSEEVRTMSDDDLLDMDYFFHEFDDEFDEYEVRFKNEALLFDTSKDIKDYLLSQIKVK